MRPHCARSSSCENDHLVEYQLADVLRPQRTLKRVTIRIAVAVHRCTVTDNLSSAAERTSSMRCHKRLGQLPMMRTSSGTFVSNSVMSIVTAVEDSKDAERSQLRAMPEDRRREPRVWARQLTNISDVLASNFANCNCNVLKRRQGRALTLDLYSHMLPSMEADAAERVDVALRAAMARRK
jgi:hypothetical protein